jgi:hypothetical protein
MITTKLYLSVICLASVRNYKMCKQTHCFQLIYPLILAYKFHTSSFLVANSVYNIVSHIISLNHFQIHV